MTDVRSGPPASTMGSAQEGWYQAPVTHYTFWTTVSGVIQGSPFVAEYASSATVEAFRLVKPSTERVDAVLDALFVKREGMYKRLR